MARKDNDNSEEITLIAVAKRRAKELSHYALGLQKVFRAKMGLPLRDDVFSGLINVKDIRERTRLSEEQIYSHAYMRELALTYPDLFGIFWDIAEIEDIYFISKDGEGRKEAILMKKIEQPSPIAISLPQVQTQPIKQEKKHWWQKSKSQEIRT